MTTRTVSELRMHIEKLKVETKGRVDGLKSRIAERERLGMGHADLDQQLGQAERAGQRGIEYASQLLKDAEAQETAQSAAQKERVAKIAADIDLKRKHQAERAWTASGGDPDAFEAAWPTIRDAMLSQSVIQETLRQDRKRGTINPTL